jgi:hypothetical protein
MAIHKIAFFSWYFLVTAVGGLRNVFEVINRLSTKQKYPKVRVFDDFGSLKNNVEEAT